MLELISLFVAATFPFAYARYSRVSNILLFVLASYGFVGLLSALAVLASIPGIILGIYVLPGVQDSGIDIGWLYSVAEVLVGPVYAISGAVLGIVGPVLLLRRFPAIFAGLPT